MRFAYLILAHKNPGQLQRLISKLDDGNSVFFVHLDKKTEDCQPFFNISRQYKNVLFVKRRVSVEWGAFSMVEATLNSLSELLEYDGAFDYVNLLSGLDYPIKSNEYIHNFFARNNGREFIYYRESPSPDLPLGGTDRYEYYYSYDSKACERNVYEAEMKLRGMKRSFIEGYKPYHGMQWWSLTGKCIDYILGFVNNNREFINYYRYTKFSDEQFFQTVVMNSHFTENVVNDSLRHIDWSQVNWLNADWTRVQPHPKTFRLTDFYHLKRSPKLFARKFDENIDKAILHYIDKLILY